MNKKIRYTALAALAVLAPIGLMAEAQSKRVVFLSVQTATEGFTGVIGKLAAEYSKQNANVAYEYQNAPQADLAQKLQLLAASNSLPTMYNVNEPSLLTQLAEKGQAADIEELFKQYGIFDKLNPAAVALQKSITGGKLLGLPLELNIEGIWYNKKLFADNGIKEPTTWDAMMAAAAKFKTAGIQPFAASGEQKWPITRLINGYVARKYGADAMARVAKGELKVTDAGFVEAASAVQEMGKKGYFGAGVNTLDYGSAQDLFLQGKAAMFYMGSWALGSLNDPKQNKIGAENVGFFNFPTVRGGKGTRNEWSLNTGIATAINPKQNDAALGAWLKYVFGNYGERALTDNGQISGFKVAKLPANLPALTKATLAKLGAAKNAYLWFEAKFSNKASSVAADNVQLLVTGDMTPENYLAELQKALN